MNSVNSRPGKTSNRFHQKSKTSPLAHSPRHGAWQTVTKISLVGLALVGVIWGGAYWFRFGTIQGVPTSIVFKFLLDEQAREAYFSGQPPALHDRLRNMGIEEEIKAFYRDQYPDEVELDWFIHQLLFDRSGYVGKNYKVGPDDQLILKDPRDRAFPQWLVLARRAQVVLESREEDGVQWVLLSNGTYATYYAVAEIYPIETLRQLIRQQKKQRLAS